MSSSGGRADDDGRPVSGNDGAAAPDSAVPPRLRQELVDELTAARRLVSSEPAAARSRVRDAETALGKRGEPGRESTPDGQRVRLAAAMRALLWHRRPESTICPSDAARAVGGEEWRDLMGMAREVAAELSRTGVVSVRQHGAEVDITTAAGPIRLARGPEW